MPNLTDLPLNQQVVELITMGAELQRRVKQAEATAAQYKQAVATADANAAALLDSTFDALVANRLVPPSQKAAFTKIAATRAGLLDTIADLAARKPAAAPAQTPYAGTATSAGTKMAGAAPSRPAGFRESDVQLYADLGVPLPAATSR